MSNSRPNFPKMEEEILEFWEKNQIFEKSIASRPEDKPYVFYDGPPFATGLPHYGHIVASTMKDVVPRYFTMRGFRVDRTWGWDCHGLPIENIVEKKFDLNSRKDIEEFGIDTFNDSCHAEVLKYVDEWKIVIRRLGRWADMENAYKTMDLPFMESIWWVFKSLWDKELIYEGHKPMHICPRCETALSNFEVNQGYADVTDISVVVTFPLTSGLHKGLKLLAWTTTPWTLPGNALAAVKEDLDYSIVEREGEKYLCVKERLEAVFEGKEFEVTDTVKGSDLVGATYEPLFPFFADHKNGFQVVAADFVTTEEGTGVVHIAPGFGEDDYELGKKLDVPPIFHVKMNGEFIDEVADPLSAEGYAVKGVPVKKKGDNQSVDIEILKALAHRGRLFSKKKYTHSYPHCWRCDTPLLNYATSSWFVRVTDMKDRLLETNRQIRWVPDNMKEGRFGKWLEGARDWAVSRSRFWGTPLPVWRSEDGEVVCVGSVKELEDLTGTKIDNLHKHFVDKLTFEKDGKEFHRIPEVLDCWFESGSMPYAQLHYPFENKQVFEEGFPAEFIAEGQDQTRGWFYTLHVLANALYQKPAFKNVIVNGIVLAEDGKKMSKRLKNYPDPMDVIDSYGADAVRYYLMSSPVVRAENLCFSEKDVAEISKKFITILLNVVSFYQLYQDNRTDGEKTPEHILDRWILARLHETLKIETEAMEAYDLQTASRILQNFVTDLSQWYVRRSRDRMKVEGTDREAALWTLRSVLETFSKMIAPFMPFLGESVYQQVGGNFEDEARLSVHLEDWPEIDESLLDEDLLEKMGRVRSIVSKALERRSEAGRPVRQVLSSATVTLPEGEFDPELIELIKDEINVKDVIVQKGEYAVELDLELTPELLREGLAREIIRRTNSLRKDQNLTIEDRIVLYVQSGSDEVKQTLKEHGDTILAGTLADHYGEGEMVETNISFRVSEQDVVIGFEKME